MSARSFRFGVSTYSADSPEHWRTKVRRAEELGYDVLLLLPDHPSDLAPFPALAAAASATSSIRLGTLVANNDNRHPVLLAHEAATIDVLSAGRLELGIGAGYNEAEYEAVGIQYAPPTTRVERLSEAVSLLKMLFAEEPVTFAGHHYSVSNLSGLPRPVQRPHPPLLVGGGARRLLSMAAREADIVSIVPRTQPDGLDFDDFGPASLAQKVQWLHDEAGDRFEQLELSTLIQDVVITQDPAAAAATLAKEWDWDAEKVLSSPYLLVGTVQGIAEKLSHLRARYGISYFAVFEDRMEEFAAVIATLSG